MLSSDTILLEHIVTEKATEASSNANQYTFKVAPGANRIGIKNAIEGQFGVAVKKIQISNVKPKIKRDRMRRGNPGRKPGYKKAIVRLKDGDSIELA